MGNLGGNLPALDIRPPAAPPDPLAEFTRVAQIRAQQQTQQAQAQEMQIRQQQINDEQATTSALKNWDPASGDFNGLTQGVLQHGGSAKAAAAAQKYGLDVANSVNQLQKDKIADYKEHQQLFADRLGPLTDPNVVSDEDLPSKAQATINDLIAHKIVDPAQGAQMQQAAQSITDPTALRQKIGQVRTLAMGSAGYAAQQKTAAETGEASAKGREANASAAMKEIEAKGLQGLTPEFISQQVDNVYDPNGTQTGGQNRLVKGQALGALQRGDVQGAKQILSDAFKSQLEEKKTIAVETDPHVQASKLELAKATKRAEQAISDGDPKDAAQLLVNGDVSPSMLVSNRKPSFATQAFTEAKNLKPDWNAQKAQADFDVAKSPANLGFFGSAKSLTDKGGTLDQLAAAAKDIPENQIPVFNSVADAVKASTGSGPIAKYASLALGVAGDYSKVMGGGQGSDTSRTQAMNLIAAKQSPEQRAQSIEGIRGAVNSQKNSRIGNNGLLQKMYGDQPSTQQTIGHKVGDIIVQNGHQFKTTKVDASGKVLAADPQ